MRTILSEDAVLPLTCTRMGTCCHGKDIRITPWELASLATARGLTASAFRERCTSDAGTRLRLAAPGWRGSPACCLYDPASGCTAHAARPLACRLYPLGRERQGGEVRYMHEGSVFPCFDGCPEVTDLPRLTVGTYLTQQGIAVPARVRDAYLEMAQDLAEAALSLVLDDDSLDPRWRQAWELSIAGGATQWPSVLGQWFDLITVPTIDPDLEAMAWVQAHAAQIQVRAEDAAPAVACVRLFCTALLLLHAVGGEAQDTGRRWLARTGE